MERKHGKLRINFEALRVLNESEARAVAGGGSDWTVCVCQSDPCNETNDTCDSPPNPMTLCQPCEETQVCTSPSWCEGCGGPTIFTCSTCTCYTSRCTDNYVTDCCGGTFWCTQGCTSCC